MKSGCLEWMDIVIRLFNYRFCSQNNNMVLAPMENGKTVKTVVW